MITADEEWHLTVKKLSALFCKITSKHDGDFYCLNFPHSFGIESKLEEHASFCENLDYRYVEMCKEESVLKCNPKEKSMSFIFIICTGICISLPKKYIYIRK